MTDSVASAGSTASKTGSSNGVGATSAAEISDRFLKLLVAQMKNQDPMDPLDNAQLTTQLAQINTVTGIEGLNKSVTSLTDQFSQMQALQAASLVGREVIVEGDSLAVTEGVAQGGFELDVAAGKVTVEVYDAQDKLLDTLDLGQQTAGKHGFQWDASDLKSTDGLTFKVTATATTGGVAVTATPLMRDTVNAVTTGGDGLTLELNHAGSTAYGDIKAFN